MKSFNNYLNEKKNGLWANIHAKRKRGEKPNPPGHPDRPTSQDFKDAQKTSKKENYVSDAQRKAVWASRNDEKKKANEAKDGDGVNIVRDREFKGKKIKHTPAKPGDPGFNSYDKLFKKDGPKPAWMTRQAKKEAVEEKTLTPAELKKREEIAKAMERENPGMPMAKKMAIATAQAKKVAEAKVDEISLSHLSNTIAKSTGTKNVKTAMKPGEVKKGLDDLRKRLSTLGQEPKLAKEAKEDDEPASPDESSMALKQLEFIEYAAEEMMDHIKSGKAFPEWFQNKLSKAHGEIEGLHSAMGEHGGDEEEKDDEDMKEETQIDEVLDTPKAMDSYRNKAKASKEKAANSAVAKMIRSKDKDNREHPAAELKTMAKRTAGERMADRLATRKTFKKLRNEAVQSADKKPEKYVKPDGKVGIRMVRTDKKVVDKDA